MGKLSRANGWLGLSLLGSLLAGCQSQPIAAPPPPVLPASPIPLSSPSPLRSPSPAPPTAASPTAYDRALERAGSAVSLSRSAQSRDDWRLVATRWQQAVNWLKKVPANSSQRSQAMQKLAEYQRNLAFAQAQALRPTTTPSGTVILTRPPQPPAPVAALPPPVQVPAASPVMNAAPSAAGSFSAPIVRRAGNTPVVRVTFNGSQSYDMILDTGASGTLITQAMANQLGVVPIGEVSADTASQQNVSFPLGYVRSVELGGMTTNNLLVAIAGPDLSIGLLGHDFFGNYDITLRQDSVEFRQR